MRPVLYGGSRFGGAYGGRVGAKSHTFAGYIAVAGSLAPMRIFCGRHIQKSIRESVHQLIQDKIDKDSNGIPLLSQLPVVGALFGLRKESARKTELVVFLKPTLVSQPSLTTDLSALRNALPDSRFLDGRQDFRQIGGVLSYEGNYQ